MKDTMVQENVEESSNDIENTTNTSSIEKRIENVFQSRVKRNFSNIEQLDSIHEKYTSSERNHSSENEYDMKEGFSSGGSSSDFFKNTKQNFTKVIPIEGKDFTSLQGWKRIFTLLFSIYPAIVNRFTDDFVDTIASNTKTNDTPNESKKKIKNDKRTLSHGAYEFIYIFIALYMTYIMYGRIYSNDSSHRLPSIVSFFETGNSTIDQFTDTLLPYVYAPCFMFQYIFTGGIPSFFSFFKLDLSVPTLLFACMFIIMYFFVYFFLDEIANMFLGIFDYRANPMMYMFIVFAWLFNVFANVSTSIESQAFGPILYVVGSIIILAVSMIIAPFAQLFFVLYLLYAFIGSPREIMKNVMGLMGSSDNTSIIYNTKETINLSDESDQTKLLTGFDYVVYTYGVKYVIFFLMFLFFLFKTIQGFSEYQIDTVRGLVSIFNICITIVMFILYFTLMIYENFFSPLGATINKEPVSFELPDPPAPVVATDLPDPLAPVVATDLPDPLAPVVATDL